MPKFNTSRLFAEKKKVTKPYVSIPKNLKEALNIDSVYKKGVFKIEPGSGNVLWDQCYIFEDINYFNKDDDKKTSTLFLVMRILKSIESQIKFTVANERQDMETFLGEIFKPIHGNEYPLLENGLGLWINQKIDGGSRDLRRLLYLTVTCRAESYEEARSFFVSLDTSLQMIFSALNSRIYRMSGEERLAVLQKILRLGVPGIPPQNVSHKKDGWKNQVMPTAIYQEVDCLEINGRYACILFGQDYDGTLDEEKVIHSLADNLFPTYITLDYEPVKRRLVQDKIETNHTNNERAIYMENDQNIKNNQYGKEPSYKLGKKKQELEQMLVQVEDNDEEGVFLGMLVMLYADSLDELDERVNILQRIARNNGYVLEPYYHRQLKALMTLLPIGGRQVNVMRSLLTSSAVAFQPFSSREIQELGGEILGMNRTTHGIASINRKTSKSPHGMIDGHTGSGKSFFVKLTEISQPLLFTDDDIICLDPNNELKMFITLLGGQYFDATPQCRFYLNPFEVPLVVWNSDVIVRNRFIAEMSEFAGRFCESSMKNINVTQIHINQIDKAVRKMYEEYFSQKKFEKHPTFTRLWEILKDQMSKEEYEERRRMLLDIIDCMEIYITGVFDMFAHQSTIDISHRLVGFGLDNVPEEYKETIMIAVMQFISMRISYNQDEYVATRLFVDEAQALCENEFAVAELLYAIETYRKKGGIITMAFQNLKHVLEHPKLCDMFSNCDYKVFFDQGGVDAAKLATIQELSEDEFNSLSENTPGYGVLVWKKQVYLLDSTMDESNPLYPIFDTDFHAKAKQKDEQKKKEEGFPIEQKILSLLDICDIDENTLVDMCTAVYRQTEVEQILYRLIESGKVGRDKHLLMRLKG